MRALSVIAFVLGSVLFVLNFIGLVIPNDQRSSFEEDLIPYQSALDLMDQSFEKHGASKEFLQEVVEIYGNSIQYVWTEDLATIPVYDNYILYFASFFDEVLYKSGLSGAKSTFQLFESVSYERGFQRGFGTCSQNALGLTDILSRRYDVEANMIGLDGHVVLSAQDSKSDKRYLLDPSVGVFMPFDLAYAETNLDTVTDYYRSTPHVVLAEKYNPQGNVFFAKSGSAAFRPMLGKVEAISDVLKWLIPICLFVIGAGFSRQVRHLTFSRNA